LVQQKNRGGGVRTAIGGKQTGLAARGREVFGQKKGGAELEVEIKRPKGKQRGRRYLAVKKSN